MTPSPNDLTRQQLDELDALLQKMLAVPITPSEPAPAPKSYVPEPPTIGNWRMDAPSPAVTRQPHIATPSVSRHEEPVMAAPRMVQEPVVLETRVDPRSYYRPESPPTPAPVGPRLFGPVDPMISQQAFVPPPILQRMNSVEPEAVPFHEEPDESITVDPPVVTFQPATDVNYVGLDDRAEVPLEMTVPPSSKSVPVPLMPVYGVNKVIEFTLGLFGPPGEMLLRPAVKWVLGLCGIGLLCGAAAWTARGMGWMHW